MLVGDSAFSDVGAQTAGHPADGQNAGCSNLDLGLFIR